MDPPQASGQPIARPSAYVTACAPRSSVPLTCRPVRMTSNGHRYGTCHATCRGGHCSGARNARAYNGHMARRHVTDRIKRRRDETRRTYRYVWLANGRGPFVHRDGVQPPWLGEGAGRGQQYSKANGQLMRNGHTITTKNTSYDQII